MKRYAKIFVSCLLTFTMVFTYKESVPDYDDILYRLMNTLYPDIEGDQWEDKWNELKRNCPKMDMDGIGQIFDLTERRS